MRASVPRTCPPCEARAGPGWDCVVGLGSNLGEREGHLSAGVTALACLGTLSAVSRIYESPAVGGPPQPPYLNAAARLATSLSPHELLRALQHAEYAEGRVRGERWGPRTLDLDLLWIRGLAVFSLTLTVPHPRLKDRAFALVPMLDVAPDAVDPADGVPYLARRGRHDTRHALRLVGSLL
jgi:2-amino-4-hydroxy-6-hydroxymethyldihydropteridine diphosphokinase